MAKVSPGVYKKVLRVREAYPFDIACLLMRFFGSMLNIGVVTMITLSGYSFLTAGLSSSLIALSIFVVTPRVSKRIDERGQSAVVPKAAAVSLLGLVVLIANVALHGPVWPLFVGALLVGFFPSPQAMARARWTYLIRSGRLGETAPDLRTMFSYESVLDDMAFIFSPSISIALAAAIAPVAGMVCGGVAFAVGVVLLCSAKVTELPTVYRVFAALMLANLCMLVVGCLGVRFFAKIVSVEKKMLYPIILVISLLGAFSINKNAFDVGVCVAFGIIGWLMNKYEFPLSPILLALILGPMCEKNFVRYMNIQRGDFFAITTSPIAMVFATVAILVIVYSVYNQSKINKRAAANAAQEKA